MLTINPHHRCQKILVGVEKTAVFVIDDFLQSTQPCLDFASVQAEFSAVKDTNYPGVRAPINTQYGNLLIRFAAPLLYHAFGIPKDLRLTPLAGFYSLINRMEGHLTPLQQHPHFDSANPYQFAIMHYLGNGDFGGTGFYRHKPSGYENISPERVNGYYIAVQDYLREAAPQQNKYFTYTNSQYELLEKVDYKPNRLLIYPSSLLHSAFIESPQSNIGETLYQSRLTSNVFVSFRARGISAAMSASK